MEDIGRYALIEAGGSEVTPGLRQSELNRPDGSVYVLDGAV